MKKFIAILEDNVDDEDEAMEILRQNSRLPISETMRRRGMVDIELSDEMVEQITEELKVLGVTLRAPSTALELYRPTVEDILDFGEEEF